MPFHSLPQTTSFPFSAFVAPALHCSCTAECKSPQCRWLWWGCSKPQIPSYEHIADIWFIVLCSVFVYTTKKFVAFFVSCLHRAITQITRLKVWVILPLIHLWQDSKDFMRQDFILYLLTNSAGEWDIIVTIYLGARALQTALPLTTLS